MSNQINHRAEAERLLDDAGEHWDATRQGRAEFDLLRAQVHATLAEPFLIITRAKEDREALHLLQFAAQAHDKLREAVRDLVGVWDGNGSATDLRVAVARLRDLVGE